MKILITGGKGMLGRTLQKELGGNELLIADLPEWDITDADAFTEKTIVAAPDVVIHCAAMTKVDDCEAKRDLAFKLNEEGSRNVALACKAAGAPTMSSLASRRASHGRGARLTSRALAPSTARRSSRASR